MPGGLWVKEDSTQRGRWYMAFRKIPFNGGVGASRQRACIGKSRRKSGAGLPAIVAPAPSMTSCHFHAPTQLRPSIVMYRATFPFWSMQLLRRSAFCPGSRLDAAVSCASLTGGAADGSSGSGWQDTCASASYGGYSCKLVNGSSVLTSQPVQTLGDAVMGLINGVAAQAVQAIKDAAGGFWVCGREVAGCGVELRGVIGLFDSGPWPSQQGWEGAGPTWDPQLCDRPTGVPFLSTTPLPERWNTCRPAQRHGVQRDHLTAGEQRHGRRQQQPGGARGLLLMGAGPGPGRG